MKIQQITRSSILNWKRACHILYCYSRNGIQNIRQNIHVTISEKCHNSINLKLEKIYNQHYLPWKVVFPPVNTSSRNVSCSMCSSVLSNRMVYLGHLALLQPFRTYINNSEITSNMVLPRRTYVNISVTDTGNMFVPHRTYANTSVTEARNMFLPHRTYANTSVTEGSNMLNMLQPRRTDTGISMTTSDVFSESNKKRVKNKLLSAIPSRRVPWGKGKKVPKAGVLVTMCTIQGKPSFLFTLRSSQLAKYRGHVR